MTQDSERFLNVYMDQNNKCNLRCVMCGFSDPRVKNIPKYDMPLWLFKKIAREVFPHTKYLALSCLTEPLMTKDFPQRLEILRRYPVPFTEIVTNATLLTEPIISRMIEVPVTRLAISLDGARAETYEKIRVGSSFEKVIGNIRKLNRMKEIGGKEFPHLRLCHVLSEINIDEFREFLELAVSLHARAVDVRTAIPFRNAAYRSPMEDIFFRRIGEARELLSEWADRTGINVVGHLRDRAEKIDLLDEKGNRITCPCPWNILAIHANGDVLPCMTWTRPALGNMASQSFEEIWRGAALSSLRREFEELKPGADCQNCTIKKNVSPDEDDDCFFLMLNKRPPDKRKTFHFLERFLGGNALS